MVGMTQIETRRWRALGWGAAAALLALPFAAMQLTSEVHWTAIDFLTFGAMLAMAGGAIELAVRASGNRLYRAGALVAVGAGFGLVWVNLAVGFLGDEHNPANLMYLGVLAVSVVGSIVARATPARMAKVMVTTAIAQALVGIVALAAGWTSPGADGRYEVVMGTSLFGGLWLLSAWLFRKAAA